MMVHRMLYCVVLLIAFVIAPPAHTQSDLMDELAILSVDNVSQLTELARIGTGRLTGVGALSPNGEQLAVGGTLGIWLYDMTNLQAPPHLIDLDVVVTDILFLHDGHYMAFTTTTGVYVIDSITHSVIMQFPAARVIGSHPDENYILIDRPETVSTEVRSYSIPVVEVWNIVEQTQVERFSLPSSLAYGYLYITDIAVSPDGRYVGASFSSPVEDTCGHRISFVVAWDPANPEDPFVLNEAENVIFSPDSRMLISERWLFAGPHIASLHIVDLDTFAADIITILPETTDQWGFVDWFGFHPINNALIAFAEGILGFWDLSAMVKTDEMYLEQDILDLEFDEAGRSVSIARDGFTIRDSDFQVVDTVTFESPYLEASLLDAGNGVSWIDQQDQLHLGVFDGTFELDEVFVSEPMATTEYDPVLSADGAYLAFKDEQSVYVVSTATGEMISEIDDTTFPVAFSDDSTRLILRRVVEADAELPSYVQVWDLPTRRMVREFGPYVRSSSSEGIITTTQLNSDNSWIGIAQQFAHTHNRYTVFSVESGDEVYAYELESGAARWTPDLRSLAVGVGNYFQSSSYSVSPLEPDYDVELHPYSYSGSVGDISPDGETYSFVTSSHTQCGGDYRQLYIHSLSDMTLKWSSGLPWRTANSIDGQFDPSSALLFSVNTIRDAVDGEVLYQFPHSTYDVIRFNDDNRYITTIHNGVLRVWGVPITE